MKKLYVMFLAMMAMVLSVNAMAETTPAATSFKIGIIDVRQVLQSSPQVASIQKKLRDEFGARDKQIQEAQQTFQKDAEKLNRDSSVMSATDRTALMQKLQTEQQSLRTMQMNFQRDIYAKQNQEMQGVITKMQAVIAKIAKEQNLNLVISKEAVEYVNQDVDITSQVTKEMGQ